MDQAPNHDWYIGCQIQSLDSCLWSENGYLFLQIPVHILDFLWCYTVLFWYLLTKTCLGFSFESTINSCIQQDLASRTPYKFYNDWLGWCKIIKVFRSKFWPLSRNPVFRPFLQTSLIELKFLLHMMGFFSCWIDYNFQKQCNEWNLH